MSWQRALAMITASMFLIASQAHGEQSVHRVGLLVSIQIPERIRAWEEELGRCGYVIGRDLLIEHRSFKAHPLTPVRTGRFWFGGDRHLDEARLLQ
jgi:hypothetical protein